MAQTDAQLSGYGTDGRTVVLKCTGLHLHQHTRVIMRHPDRTRGTQSAEITGRRPSSRPSIIPSSIPSTSQQGP